MGNFTDIQNEFNLRVNIKLGNYLNQQKSLNRPIDQNEINKIKVDELLQFRLDKMKDLSNKTDRNVICYYSAWLQGNLASPNQEVQIYDNDMNGFMNAVYKLDKRKGLDLILHTPGGVTTATESIVKYLRKIFKNNIRVIVPHMAMSAGTMIACSSKSIILGKESSLGPVDPQYHNVPAQGVLKEFERAINEVVTSPNKSLVWREIIQQYRPTFIGECENVVKLSEELLRNWLETGMFKNSKLKNKTVIIDNIVNELINHDKSKVHDRHYGFDECKQIGLKVKGLENDPDLQDKVLSLYHSYILSVYLMPNAIKFIEAQNGNSFVITGKR